MVSSSATSPETQRLPALYRSMLQQAAQAGERIMRQMTQAAAEALQQRLDGPALATEDVAAWGLRRERLAQSLRQLRAHEALLERSFPAALQIAFADASHRKPSAANAMVVNFDQLELMAPAQVHTSVVLNRVEQTATQCAEQSLFSLNAWVSGLLGLQSVRPDVNPVRPQVFVQALRKLLEATDASEAEQAEWLQGMGPALGRALDALYQQLTQTLRDAAVTPAPYAATQAGISAQKNPAAGGASQLTPPQFATPAVTTPSAMPSAGPLWQGPADTAARGTAQGTAHVTASSTAQSASQGAPHSISTGTSVKASGSAERSQLTLLKLRQLLAGELDAGPVPEGARRDAMRQFSEDFAKAFDADGPSQDDTLNTDFQSTVPHALEALTEMDQVEKVVHQIEARRSNPKGLVSGADASLEAVRARLRATARNQAQALSLEVVSLMVDNVAQDERLLEPVQSLVRNLEPALLRLALVDPRFFTDKQHPARQLLQEVTQHSLAFPSENATGFADFMQDVGALVLPLKAQELENAEPFHERLNDLRELLGRKKAEQAGAQTRAMEALQQAEARNLLAEQIGREIEALPAAAVVSRVVVNFLCGPWAQVVAKARLEPEAASQLAEYEQAITDLLWSTQRDLGRDGLQRLARLVPRLVPMLRQGLASIFYSESKTSAFLDQLMRIHQRAFRSAADAPESVFPGTEGDVIRWVEDGDPWLAPDEAARSCLMALESDSQLPAGAEASEPVPLLPDLDLALERLAQWDNALTVGIWVELFKDGQWMRMQLSWASPHGTLYLFTSPFGQTQSMSRRTVDRLVESDRLRLVATGSLVDGAMDAVARTALHNSVHAEL